VWNDEAEDLLPMDIDEGSDRLFTFEVAKTNEQDEDVVVRPGFTVSMPNIYIYIFVANGQLNACVL
jgi:hypothetical protein